MVDKGYDVLPFGRGEGVTVQGINLPRSNGSILCFWTLEVVLKDVFCGLYVGESTVLITHPFCGLFRVDYATIN
ncbi:hypothetical protein L2E82_12446 [Cichorium intybus]|uniref:Uncharacterized protein n=1 Tax=Cichorium intybus TaxID=13427 RepID=A0ACB9GH54_CICIN|nr:hypothetical protein L2E82_12446 [Cichorium intybus]